MADDDQARRGEDLLWWRAEEARANEQRRKIREEWARHPAPNLTPGDDDE